jgi:hypothetical protein
MNFTKFKLVNSINKEVIGFEYLTIDGWKNDVFDFGERQGTFDQVELGDGFLGIVQRFQFVTTDKNGKEVFVGDNIEYQLHGGIYLNKGLVFFDTELCAYLVNSDRIPKLSECIVFSLIPA